MHRIDASCRCLLRPLRRFAPLSGALARALFHKFFHQSELFLRIRVVAHREVEPSGFFDDAACVREGVEALFAVIAAHAAVSYAAEGHVRGGKMDDRIIDTAAAKRQL